MESVLNQLVALLTLETIEENLFRGVSQDLGVGCFGGQVKPIASRRPARR
jgi:acyl-CoA thioesterase-2